MTYRQISLVVIVFWAASLLAPATQLASAQSWEDLSPDLDGDGLLNSLESGGWYNEAGGPYVSDPSDADSDDDGLTDGEEKLFNTSPVDHEDPGLYVQYQDTYRTFEYYSTTNPDYISMHQAGDRYLMTEAMVVRRGTTLRIGGPSAATLTVSGDGLTDLTPYTEKDIYGGGWNVSFPLNGTVGTYTATVSLGGWQKEMPIHVIFELPTKELTPDKINAFLYDDDPNDARDETAVIFSTALHTDRSVGFSKAFWTDHYQKFVFVDQVMPTIRGTTTQEAATDVLSARADREVRVDYDDDWNANMYDTLYRYWDGTGWTQRGTPCQNQAGVLTGFLRASGIAAKVFIVDFKESSDDHSVLVWLNNQWMAARSYQGGENDNPAYQYYPFNHGHTPHNLLKDWDYYGSYAENLGTVLVTVNGNWDYELWRAKDPGESCALGEASDGTECFLGGMVGTRWKPYPQNITQALEYKWFPVRPLQLAAKHPYVETLNTIVWKGEPWLPFGWPDAYELPAPYPGGDITENWPIEPVPQDCPAGYLDVCPYQPLGVPVASPARSQHAPEIQPTPLTQSDKARLGSIVNVYGVDTDDSGRFDALAVDAEVTVLQPGTYTLGGRLALPRDTNIYTEIYADTGPINLDAGTQVVQLQFDGREIGRAAADGPFQIAELWITDLDEFDARLGPWDGVLDLQRPHFVTPYFMTQQFEVDDASLADVYSQRGVDADGDGRYEAVAIAVTLDISKPGTYQVDGALYDAVGGFVGRASWTGPDKVASLLFDLEQSAPPYTLEKLRLSDMRGAVLDSRYRNAYTFVLDGPVDRGTVSVNLHPLQSDGVGPLGESITPTHVFDDTGLDLDDDGLYDQLVIDVQVQASQADSYRVEGWLEDSDGYLIAHTISAPAALNPGLRTLSLHFDGRAINGQAKDGPYSLIGLKILDASSYDVLDEVKTTGLAMDYDASDFENESNVALLFSDDVERGTGKWNWVSPWNLDHREWPSPAHLWRAEASGAQSGSLETMGLHTSDYARPLLRFDTTFSMDTVSDSGYVEASTNGVAWTRLATYSNDVDRWSTKWLDLSDFGELPNLLLRFKANASEKLLWYVDDVHLYGQPAVTSAYYTYTPTEVVAGEPITFVASYDSIDRTLPVTYTWDFGDGAPLLVTHLPTVIHQFAASTEYRVQLTVENPYDDAQLTLIVGAGDPVTGVTFNYSPAVPEVMTSIQFTADHSPSDATTPVTYTWNFGDNTTLATTGPNISHSYTAGGFYNVKLTAYNGYGIATHNQVIQVKEGVAEVAFTYKPISPLDGDSITFYASFEPETASLPINYTWEFGDGSDPVITTVPNVTHIFNGVGVYTVEVTAFNGYGTSAYHNATISIDGRPLSGISFHLAQIKSQNESETTFHADYAPFNATQPVTYTWSFGDGTTLTTANAAPTHEFTPPIVPYTYTVRLAATNGWGPPVTFERQVRLPFDDDDDGLTNSEEFQIGTDPQNRDTDGDSLWDGAEVNGYLYTGYPPHEDFGQHIDTNPLDADTDDDLLRDGSERSLATHPRDPDTDDDGLLDGEEPGIAGTPNPLNPDTDDDGLLDGKEVKASLTDPLKPDSDGDSILDPIEVDEDNDPDNPLNPANHPDTDNDGVFDAWDLDSDADSISDASEWSTSSDDPLIGCSATDNPICTNNNVDGDYLDNYRDPNAENDCALDRYEFDINGDGIPDDGDSDGIPNWLDSGICTYLSFIAKHTP